MNLAEMRTALSDIIQDPSYTDEYLDNFINYAYLLACGEVELSSLKRLDVVTTVADQYSLDLSTLTGGFAGRLSYIGRSSSSSTSEVKVCASLELLLSEYPGLDKTGSSVVAVAVEGSTLYYQPAPASVAAQETLRVVYYRNPSELSAPGDIPTHIPEMLHRELLINGAAWAIFDQIEDGLDGEKINAKAYYWRSFSHKNAKSGINRLYAWKGANSPHFISSTWAN